MNHTSLKHEQLWAKRSAAEWQSALHVSYSAWPVCKGLIITTISVHTEEQKDKHPHTLRLYRRIHTELTHQFMEASFSGG